MDQIDFGDYGMLSPEEALAKMQKLDKDYKSLQSEFTKRSQTLKEHEEYAQVVNLINDLGLGDQVAGMIMQAQSGGYPTEYGPEAYQQPGKPPNDPYVMDMMAEIDELKQQLQGVQQMYWGDKAQQDISNFRAAHSDLTDEQMDEIGNYMIEGRFPTLDAAYKYMKFDDMMEAARLDGEKRVKEQMRAGRQEGEGTPILGGGEGGLEADEGKPPPGDWNAAAQAAIEDARESGWFEQ